MAPLTMYAFVQQHRLCGKMSVVILESEPLKLPPEPLQQKLFGEKGVLRSHAMLRASVLRWWVGEVVMDTGIKLWGG